MSQLPISALPLPRTTLLVTYNLTPDPHTSDPITFHKLQSETPSLQRRARIHAPEAHFSHVAPCPLPFPYRIEPPEDGQPIADQAAYVERWLAAREALQERPTVQSPVASVLKKYYAEKREQPRILIGLAKTCLQDCLPNLDVGDAFATLGTPSLTGASDNDQTHPSPSADAVAVREELVDVLSGHATLMSVEESSEVKWAPWSLRYSGHQFGNWAGQLGDGRAISILSTPHPSDSDSVIELQLKGAGRTPFSRTADGLAVLRSSIREFLCSEAMYALGIPTTRALALVALPELPVIRETTESACVLTRVAPSFLRIGNFEALSPPEGMFFLGGGQQEAHWDALRILGEFVARRVLKLEGLKWREGEEEGDAWGTQLVMEVARRNAKMVAGWQAYGFMHGVINTDNVSILGLTIDYGPYAFMDVFNPHHICNHSDEGGRYAYKYQPSMIVYALRALLNALAPLIGAEHARGGKAVQPGWADNVPSDTFAEWRKQGLLLKDEVERVAEETCAVEYGRLMHKRLGLRRFDPSDESKYARPLLNLMDWHRLDFHGTFRRLSHFRPSIVQSPAELNAFVGSLLGLTSEPERLEYEKAENEVKEWLQQYADRVVSEQELWGEDMEEERIKAMRGANPRFVLRQWLLEEVIENVEKDLDKGKRILGKVLQMACNPFEPWGAEDHEGPEEELSAEVKEERRYCGMGERKFLGFQCSCSS